MGVGSNLKVLKGGGGLVEWAGGFSLLTLAGRELAMGPSK